MFRAGYGTAARLALEERVARAHAGKSFKRATLAALAPLNPIVNGTTDHAVANMVNVSLPGIDGEAALVATKDLIAISNGSACTSHSYEPSHVLVGMGLDDMRTRTSLRLSWSHLMPLPDWSAVVDRLQPLKS
ncbi:MAG: hypothetical protein H0T43_04290 [Solirubrobacterales bacterium]|nr:hypothetical protein [Solirubrobacterales bacterium]